MSDKDTIYRQAAIRWVKTECNPYGNPTLDFESGKKVIEHLEQMPSAQPDCSDCIKHGGDWDCDHVHCHKGESAQSENQNSEWKECGTITIEGYKAGLKECSKCHSVIVGYGNFCPVCGAKME